MGREEMRICVAAEGDSLDALVAPRFGKSKYFIAVDSESSDFKAIPNPSFYAVGAAGIQASHLVVKKGVEMLLTGNIGPIAFQILEEAGIEIIVATADISIREAIEKFKKGEWSPIKAPTVVAHFDISPGHAQGADAGQDVTKKQDLQILAEEAKYLKQRLDEINKILVS
jgi:predicted Fe-Mo cluster-binding NifX family protein